MRILIAFLIYGILVALANIYIMGKPGDYIVYHILNFPVERFIISPILLYLANETNHILNSSEVIVLRLVSGVLFWGVVGTVFQFGRRYWLKK